MNDGLFIYFSGSDPLHFGVSGMPVGFRIDDSSGHHAKYNVSGIIF